MLFCAKPSSIRIATARARLHLRALGALDTRPAVSLSTPTGDATPKYDFDTSAALSEDSAADAFLTSFGIEPDADSEDAPPKKKPSEEVETTTTEDDAANDEGAEDENSDESPEDEADSDEDEAADKDAEEDGLR